MSSSVFESGRFQLIQNYHTSKSVCAVEDKEARDRNKEIVSGLIKLVLDETKDGITDEHAGAYETFLSNVETIEGEYKELNYENPFSDSIDQMRKRLVSHKQEKKDLAFKRMVSSIAQFDTSKTYSPSTVKVMESRLEGFVNEIIDDRLSNFEESDKSNVIKVAQKIKVIGQHVKSDKILGLADRLELAVLQSHPKYLALLSDRTIVFNSAETAQTVASQVNNLVAKLAPFFRAREPHVTRSDAQKLLKRLYEADDAMIKVGILDEISPLAEAIGYLEKALNVSPRERPLPKKEKIEKEEVKSPSKCRFEELRARFNKQPEASSFQGSVVRSSSPKVELSDIERRDRFALSVAKRLEGLQRMDNTELFQLRTDLQRNRHLFSGSDQNGIDALIQALDLLRNSQTYRPSAEESALMNQWKMQLGAYGISSESYQRTIEPVQRETKGRLIGIIQESGGSFSKLNIALKEALPSLEGQAIVQRFLRAEVTQKQSKPFSREIALNFANTIQQMQAFKVESREYLLQKWSGVLRKFDETTSGKVSPIVAQLGYCNLERQLDSIEARLNSAYLKEFGPELFGKATTEPSKVFLKSLEGVKVKETKLYEQRLRRSYQSVRPYLKWIVDHASFIRSTYDQGSDFNRNMGNGTCERNSEDRHKLLLRTPFVPSEKIALGSSSVGRHNQVMRDVVSQLAKRIPQGKSLSSMSQGERLIVKEVQQKLKAIYERVGLNSTGVHAVAKATKGSTPQEALWAELTRLVMDEKETLFILGMDAEKGPGHAINIQVDLKAPIFRFIDDNIGVVECPDAKTFREALTSWLSTAYPDLTSYDLSTFEIM